MIVYGASMSPFVRKVLVVAAEKGIAVELKPVMPGAPNPEFRAVSPFGKMPALVDGDFSVSDSTAIVTYLEALHPEPALLPAEPRARARAVWFEEFADTIMASALGKVFFNRVVARLIGREGDAAVADKAAAEDVPPLYDYLEGVLGDGGFLVGNALTIADVAVGSQLANAHHAHVAADATRYPKVAAFAAAMLARESFATWLAREEKALARVG